MTTQMKTQVLSAVSSNRILARLIDSPDLAARIRALPTANRCGRTGTPENRIGQDFAEKNATNFIEASGGGCAHRTIGGSVRYTRTPLSRAAPRTRRRLI
jgi:hypothetical protein